MVLYPSRDLHHVEPVTQGVRLAVVGWVQSLIRDSQQRSLLFDLDVVRRSLFEKQGKTLEFDLISKSHSNLLRQWVEL
jgi:PKHD-type hydroxylase